MNQLMPFKLVSSAGFLLCVLVWGWRRWQLTMWQMPIPGSRINTACALGWLWNAHYLPLNSCSIRTKTHGGYSVLVSSTANSFKSWKIKKSQCCSLTLKSQGFSLGLTAGERQGWKAGTAERWIRLSLWFSGCLLKTALEKDAMPQADVTFNRFSNITPIFSQARQGGKGEYNIC